MKNTHTSAWWGAPRKFSVKLAERKISWLELFYDLVYVVAISRITEYFSRHADVSGFLDYMYLFIMVFWGWFNGSMYHDLHGTAGIRTRLMTLWQMVAVAAMIVCLKSPPDKVIYRGTIAIMVMQFYITYLWWSVGIYDKEHRKLNFPYTVCYLLSLVLNGTTLFLHTPYTRIFFFVSLFLNFLPPFYVSMRLGDRDFKLSASMTERLGLFAIIMFGEVVAGIINGVANAQDLSIAGWSNFVFAVLITFALWWIFFALVADRECKGGYLKGQLMIMAYIPVLMSLGMLAATFAEIFSEADQDTAGFRNFAFRISVFLAGTIMTTNFLKYPYKYELIRKRMQQILLVVALLISATGYLFKGNSLIIFFSFVLVLLITVIVVMTRVWLKFEVQDRQMPEAEDSAG